MSADATDIVSVDEDEETRLHRISHPCDVCQLVMDPADWANRHWPHEPDCEGPGFECRCDLEVHADCCQFPGCTQHRLTLVK